MKIHTDLSGNKLHISRISVRKVALPQYYRYEFSSPDDVYGGKLYWAAGGSSALYINGVLVSAVEGQGPLWRKLNVASIKRYIRPGKNVIAVYVDGYGAGAPKSAAGGNFFFIGGGYIDKSGVMYPIMSSNEWRGAVYAGDNWYEPDYDGGEFEPVKEYGAAQKHMVGGQRFDQWAEFDGFPDSECFDVVPLNKTLPFFKSSEDVVFELECIDKLSPSGVGSVEYSVDSSNAGESVISNKLDLRQMMDSGGRVKLQIPLNVVGAFTLSVRLKLAGEVYSKKLEFVRVGKISQTEVTSVNPEDGMNLREVDKIVPAQISLKDMMYGSGGRNKKSQLTASKANADAVFGNARELIVTGKHANDWVSVKFSVENVYKPHLIKIRYPSGTKRNMSFIVAEKSADEVFRNQKIGSGFVRASSGVYTDVSPSEEGVEYMIFWPSHKEQTFTLVNAGGRLDDVAAISDITIYEVQDGLPSFHNGSRNGRVGLIGPFVERIDRVLPRVFYAGSQKEKFPYQYLDGPSHGYYAAWYITIRNLITYLRYSGQNTLFAGIYMYHGGWMSNKDYQAWPETGRKYLPEGWEQNIVDLMAIMFDENDLNLVLSVQFIGTSKLLAKGNVTNEEVKSGAKTHRFVSRWGEQIHSFQAGGFNFFDDEVKKEMLGLAKCLSDKYSRYRSIRGIMWNRLPEFDYGRNDPKIRTPLDIGYGDETIEKFEEDCQCTIPVSGDPATRFEERYEYLANEKQEQWLKWRADQVAELYKEIYKNISARESDWQLFILLGRPPHGLLSDWDGKKYSIEKLYLMQGYEENQYSHNPNIQLLQTYDLIGGRKFGRHYDGYPVARAIRHLDQCFIDGDFIRRTDGLCTQAS